MRATRDGRHISGAERLSDATTAPDIARTLVARALHHPRGIPDDIHVTVRAVHPADIRRLTALPVTVRDTTTPAQAHAEVARLLSPGVLAALLGVVDLPGALLIDATGHPLGPVVRVSSLDWAGRDTGVDKQHASEALALALGTSRPWWERLFLGAGGLLLLLPPGWFTGVGVALLGVVILRHRVRRASTLAA